MMRVPPQSTQSKPQRRRPRALMGIVIAVVCFCVTASVAFVYAGGISRWVAASAQRAIEQRDFELAHDRLRKLDRIDPHNAQAALMRAEIARLTGDPLTAQRMLMVAAGRGVDTDQLERERILGAVQQGDIAQYESQLKQWLLDPTINRTLVCDAYANGLAAQSRFDEAIAILNAWHLDYPDDPVALFRLGRIQEYFLVQDQAAEFYRQAIAANNDFLPAHFSLARILLDTKKAEQAKQHFQTCWQSDADAAAMVGVAQCLVALGENDQAATLFNQVVQLPIEKIMESYHRFEEQPERYLAAEELGKLEVQRGNLQQAMVQLDAALKFNPRDNIARYSRAIALRGLGRIDEAEAELARVQETKTELAKVNPLRNEINRNPENPDLRIQLGKLMIEYESPRNGLFWIRSALAHDPHCQAAHRALAEYYEQHASQNPQYRELAKRHRQQLDDASASVAQPPEAPILSQE